MPFLYNPASLSGDEAALKDINLGTTWGTGELRAPYTADNPAPQKADVRDGTKASPDTAYQPTFAVSRVLNVSEASFAGAGEGGLPALRATAVAVEGSQGQAIGATFGGVTESSYEGAKSLADGLGSAHIGISRKGTRTGLGIFVNGRRETASGRTTGAEIVSDNATETSESYAGTLPGTKGIHLHPFGTADSACGLVLGHPSTATWDVGIGAIASSVKTAVYRDDSSALRSILVRGTHEKAAIAVASGAGQVVLGAEEPSAAGPLLELFGGEANFDPILKIGTGKPFASSVEVRTEAGNCKLFASASTNGFLTGTGNGGTGILFSNTKTFSIGRVGAAGELRIGGGLGFYGTAPVAQPKVTGSRATGEASKILLEKLAAIGLILNESTA